MFAVLPVLTRHYKEINKIVGTLSSSYHAISHCKTHEFLHLQLRGCIVHLKTVATVHIQYIHKNKELKLSKNSSFLYHNQ